MSFRRLSSNGRCNPGGGARNQPRVWGHSRYQKTPGYCVPTGLRRLAARPRSAAAHESEPRGGRRMARCAWSTAGGDAERGPRISIKPGQVPAPGRTIQISAACVEEWTRSSAGNLKTAGGFFPLSGSAARIRSKARRDFRSRRGPRIRGTALGPPTRPGGGRMHCPGPGCPCIVPAA